MPTLSDMVQDCVIYQILFHNLAGARTAKAFHTRVYTDHMYGKTWIVKGQRSCNHRRPRRPLSNKKEQGTNSCGSSVLKDYEVLTNSQGRTLSSPRILSSTYKLSCYFPPQTDLPSTQYFIFPESPKMWLIPKVPYLETCRDSFRKIQPSSYPSWRQLWNPCNFRVYCTIFV